VHLEQGRSDTDEMIAIEQVEHHYVHFSGNNILVGAGKPHKTKSGIE
jgi:hypothetical protein